MAKNDDAVEKFLEGIYFKNPSTEEISGPNGLLKLLTKSVIEKAMNAEMTEHLGYEKNQPAETERANFRNGKSKKTVITEIGDIDIAVPRDRNAAFKPKIIKKHQRRFEGFDDKILSMYDRGMTTRDIQGYLEEIYGVEVSHDLISDVTNEVIKEVQE